ncbi:hypothetical protein FPV67DRAFT_831413 [Lyophyllum atratum]|nr:hypothetical protein FPV67DRAFT_831413 [Lyophyllum atratum]
MIRGALLENANVPLIERPDLVNRRLHKLNGALMWLSLLPPIINDSVVIWRGWVLFPERRRVLIAAMILCLVSFATALAVLPLSLDPDEYSAFLEQRPDLAWYLENAAPVLSLATNVIATSCIAYGLWLHRKFLVTLFNRRQQRQFRVQKSLSLLVESGIVYCGLQAIVLMLGFLDPADGSHMSMDIATQVFATVYMVVSAMYPSLVAFLVQQQGSSFRESYASQDYGMHMDERP